MLDEGVFGACHLLVHFYLVSKLEPSRYGAFALAMVWGLLAASAHQAFFVEPFAVLGQALPSRLARRAEGASRRAP